MCQAYFTKLKADVYRILRLRKCTIEKKTIRIYVKDPRTYSCGDNRFSMLVHPPPATHLYHVIMLRFNEEKYEILQNPILHQCHKGK